MTAILKKEVRAYLTSMTGYVFTAFLLVVSGIYFTAYHLMSGYPLFAYTLDAVLVVMLLMVPVLTMRSLAEERKQKTDQLLLTAPVTVGSIVMGKYLALVTIFLIPVCVLACYPLVLSQFGTIPYGETYTALLGFFLMGCSFLAVGLYLSAVTESQVIAAVLTFLFLFVSYLIEGIASFFPETASASFFSLVVLVFAGCMAVKWWTKNNLITGICLIVGEGVLIGVYIMDSAVFAGLIQQVLGILNISAPFSEFANGMLDLTGVVYYLSVIGIALFLTVQSIQKRRWS